MPNSGTTSALHNPSGQLQRLWLAISSLGVSTSDSSYFARKILLTNKVGVIMFSAGLALAGGFLISAVPTATVRWFMTLVVGLWFVPFLNYRGYRKLSRHVLSTVLPLFLIVFVAHIRSTYPESVHGASFYIPRFFLLGISFLPIILFGYEEKKHLIGSFSINILMLLFYNEIMNFFGAGMGVAESAISDPFFISISSVVALIIVSTGYFFLNKLNSEYELRIEQLLVRTRTQNKSMQAAVDYAQNLQQIILPNKELLDRHSKNLFAFYKPLHTVSGDFYFIEENESHLLIAVVDCTGHGVPGAIMSMMANSALQRAISAVGIEAPEKILTKANQLFHDDVTHSGSTDIQDGMDLILASVNKASGNVTFSGANLSAFVLNADGMKDLRMDKGGICAGSPKRVFSSTSVQLSKGDHFYLSTDGYIDQFGGERDKRIRKRGFKDLIQLVSGNSMSDQNAKLSSFFQNWKADAEQIDDVCVVGYRI